LYILPRERTRWRSPSLTNVFDLVWALSTEHRASFTSLSLAARRL
jgi:hypothetical protein